MDVWSNIALQLCFADTCIGKLHVPSDENRSYNHLALDFISKGCCLVLVRQLSEQVTNWSSRVYMESCYQYYAHNDTRRVGWASMGDCRNRAQNLATGSGPKHGAGCLPIGLTGVSLIGWPWRAMEELGKWMISCNHTSFDDNHSIENCTDQGKNHAGSLSDILPAYWCLQSWNGFIQRNAHVVL